MHLFCRKNSPAAPWGKPRLPDERGGGCNNWLLNLRDGQNVHLLVFKRTRLPLSILIEWKKKNTTVLSGWLARNGSSKYSEDREGVRGFGTDFVGWRKWVPIRCCKSMYWYPRFPPCSLLPSLWIEWKIQHYAVVWFLATATITPVWAPGTHHLLSSNIH